MKYELCVKGFKVQQNGVVLGTQSKHILHLHRMSRNPKFQSKMLKKEEGRHLHFHDGQMPPKAAAPSKSKSKKGDIACLSLIAFPFQPSLRIEDFGIPVVICRCVNSQGVNHNPTALSEGNAIEFLILLFDLGERANALLIIGRGVVR